MKLTEKRGLRWGGLAAGVALICLAFLPPGIYSVDGNAMLAVAESLVAHHSFAVEGDLGVVGRGGQAFSKWYPLQSFLAVPFVAAGVQMAHVLRLPAHYIAAICSLVLPAVFTGLTAALVALVSEQLGSSPRGAFLASLAYAFGTIAMVYARTFYADPLLALLTAACIYLVLAAEPKRIFWAAALAGLAVLAKPTGIVVGPLLTLYLLATTHAQNLRAEHSLSTTRSTRPLWLSLVPAAGALAGLLLYFGYNQLRFGHPLSFGQPWAFRISAIVQGAAGLLVSPGRGLVWYSPPILLTPLAFQRVRRAHLPGALLVAAVFLAYLGLHSLWTFWAGGWSWGPRFLLPALPGLAALLGLLEGRWRRTLLALTLAGFLIGAPTLFTFYERYYAEQIEQGVSERDSLWAFSQAPFLHAWQAALRQVRDAQSADVRDLLAQRGAAPASSIASSRALRIVAVWWWVLPAARIPRAVGAAVSLLLVALGCAALQWQAKGAMKERIPA